MYIPTYKAYTSEIIEPPVMCTTTRAFHNETCKQPTCGEWCLSKGAGPCILVYVHLRQNGSSLMFNNCSNPVNKSCYGIDIENSQNYTCIYKSCQNMTGLFNCTKGVCYNLTDAFICVANNKEPPMNCHARRGHVTCKDIKGIFNCTVGMCERIKEPYNCERRCLDIPTLNKNVILMSGNKVYLSKCESATDLVTQKEVWNEALNGSILMASCHEVKRFGDESLTAVDCINGSLTYEKLEFFSNFTHLLNLHQRANNFTQIAPNVFDLTISNESLLLINLEGCVNTLSDECKKFFKHYAKDGSDHNAPARFPCYYSELKKQIAVARFDLNTEYNQFLFAFFLPSVLLITSCFTLVLCQQTVVVGDDSKMRYRGFKHCITADVDGKPKLDNGDEL